MVSLIWMTVAGSHGLVRIAVVLVGLIVALGAPPIARADSTPTPTPGWKGNYMAVSANNRYVLVMLGNISCDPCFTGDDWVGTTNALGDKYSASGLYTNDGSTEPLWTIGYISWRKSLTLASDGHHMVVWGDWPLQGMDYANEALSFYEDGQLIKSYQVRDLVTNPAMLPHSVSHYEWLEHRKFDGESNKLLISTLLGEAYTFDVASGHIVSTEVPTSVAKQNVELIVEPTSEPTVKPRSIDDYLLLYQPKTNPILPAWAALAVGVVSFGCLLGGLGVARRRRKRRWVARVRRVVWRVPVE